MDKMIHTTTDTRIALDRDGFQMKRGPEAEYCFVEDVDWREICEVMDRRNRWRWVSSPAFLGSLATGLTITLIVLGFYF